MARTETKERLAKEKLGNRYREDSVCERFCPRGVPTELDEKGCEKVRPRSATDLAVFLVCANVGVFAVKSFFDVENLRGGITRAMLVPAATSGSAFSCGVAEFLMEVAKGEVFDLRGGGGIRVVCRLGWRVRRGRRHEEKGFRRPPKLSPRVRVTRKMKTPSRPCRPRP